MFRLSGLDTGFLSMDLPQQPMNSMALARLRPATGPDGQPQLLTLDYLRAHIIRRIETFPSWRRTLVNVPLGWHHPVMIDDGAFDIDKHLHHVAVPAPGGRLELDRLVARIAERHLDRSRPLWELYLIEGIEDGRQAVLFRAQHSILDGVGMTTTISRLFTDEDAPIVVPDEAWAPEPRPSRRRLMADALHDQRRLLRELPELARRTAKGVKAKKAFVAQSPVPVPNPLADTPACSFNNAFCLDRNYVRASLPIADIKAVKDVAGVSLNDVVLAVMAGSLRAYLVRRDDLPDRPLVANVPVSTEPAGTPPRQYGNNFNSIACSLATDEADPWARLMRIAEGSTASKTALDKLGPTMLGDWLEYAPPWLAVRALTWHRRYKLRHPEQADFSIGISNIRGPVQKWSLGTAEAEEIWLSGPPSFGTGSNVTLWSYGDQLVFTAVSFADALEDPVELFDGLRDSLDELLAAAEARRGRPLVELTASH